MNNLILAVIAIAFGALVMTAGIAYLTPRHAILNTEATSSTIEIDQMLADYNSLKTNIGHVPSAQDYIAVYGQDGNGNIKTQNAVYQSTGSGLSRASFLQSIPQVGNMATGGAASGWEFVKGCHGILDANGQAVDCFQMTVNASYMQPADAETTCQALTLAQKRLSGTSMALNIQNSDGSPHTCN